VRACSKSNKLNQPGATIEDKADKDVDAEQSKSASCSVSVVLSDN
jgi:hypothetical protein